MTTQQILESWERTGAHPVLLKSVQNWVAELSLGKNGMPPLIKAVPRGGRKAYYLRTSEVAKWFLTEEAALDLEIARQVFGTTFGTVDGSYSYVLSDAASNVVEQSRQLRHLRERLSIVPDGIGRLPAKIDAVIRRTLLEAIRLNRRISFSYLSSRKRRSSVRASPLGLVAKDGTVYLVAANGFEAPFHYPLHRIESAVICDEAAEQHFGNFNLRKYIADTHQFSHVLNKSLDPVLVKLRVSPQAFYHFDERPLANGQQVSHPTDHEPWYIVTAKIPITVLLVPFILSMGPWVEVLEPKALRSEVIKRARGIAQNYEIS
jgi:predicted DNA-binding transcriptional regulator YafY